MKRIAIEEAFVTPEISEEWKKVLGSKNVDPGFREMGKTIHGDNPSTKMVHARLIDLGAGRIAHMDATGIAMQVLSLTAPRVQVFDAITGTALARQANDRLAEAVQSYPTRFAGLAAIAPQHPESAAESLGAPIYLHPREPAPGMVQPYLDYGLYFAGWGFAAEAGLHAMRLIMCGVFDRFPKLKIILGHMGEGIPFWLQRIDNRYLLQVRIGAVNKMPRLPSEYFKDNFVITTSGVTHH